MYSIFDAESTLMPSLRCIFLLAMLLSCNSIDKKERPADQRIGIVELGDVHPGDLEKVTEAVRELYRSEAVMLSRHSVPSNAWYAPRQRHKADSLLNFLSSLKPDSIDKIIGIMSSDISTSTEEHIDWGVFGLAGFGGNSCIISCFRLHKSSEEGQKATERLQKVALHELGHTFGLDHCTSGDQKCLMRDADGKLGTVDKETLALCDECNKMLQD